MSTTDDRAALIAAFDAIPRHGDDSDHCGVCAGPCGGWPGEMVDISDEKISRLLAALKDAEQEKAAALAVIELVKAAWFGPCAFSMGLDGPAVTAALATAPTDALKARDAEKWDEGEKAGVANQLSWDGWRYSDPEIENPYRDGGHRG